MSHNVGKSGSRCLRFCEIWKCSPYRTPIEAFGFRIHELEKHVLKCRIYVLAAEV